jgi:hypothetical protein
LLLPRKSLDDQIGPPQTRETRKNLFDLRRIAAVENLDTTRRTKDRAANAAA